jgi:uncharacterized protein
MITAPILVPTITGQVVDLLQPDPAAVDIRDIAYSLARICRWNGYVKYATYSVAQHSILVSESVPPPLALAGLLHDAAEAYLGDVDSRLKKLLPVYVELERAWALAIGERFGLGVSLADPPPEVLEADARSLATERRDLTRPLARGPAMPPADLAAPYDITLGYLATEFAADAFLNRFDRLTGGRK